MDTIQTEIYKGRKIHIVGDPDPINPRENDNLGTMFMYHPRYSLGDTKNGSYHYKDAEYYRSGHEAIEAFNDLMLPLEDSKGNTVYQGIAMKVFMYDHSGLWLEAEEHDFPDARWDVSMIGWIVMPWAKMVEEYGDITPEQMQKIKGYLKAEVKEYGAYLNGDVYGYQVALDGEVESCYGFYSTEDALEEAKSIVNWAENHAEAVESRSGEHDFDQELEDEHQEFKRGLTYS